MKDPATLIATSSLIVAVAAVAVAIWQGMVSRRAAMLSLRPIIEISTFSGTGLGISISNVGHGPALIHSIRLKSGTLTLELCGTSNYEPLTDLFCPEGAHVRFNAKIPETDSVIAAGQELPIFTVDETDNLGAVTAHFKQLFADCHITVKYSSLYDEAYESIYSQARAVV